MEHGLLTIIGDEVQKFTTLQCVHCGGHFVSIPGSGKKRGFCFKCNGVFCGPGCIECKPIERWLDEMDSGKNPTAVSVPVLWTP